MDQERIFQTLQRLTNNESVRYDLSKPFRREVGGVKYAVATDGISLLAIEVSADAFAELREAPMKEPERVDSWLIRANTQTVNMADLLAFLNAAEYRKCPLCKGSGERLIEKPNEELDGDKPWFIDPFTYYDKDESEVFILGVRMDRYRVVDALAWMPVQPMLEVVIPEHPTKAPLVFFGGTEGGRWALAIMSMSGDRKESVPEFGTVDACKVAV